jgi:hypothetical protein
MSKDIILKPKISQSNTAGTMVLVRWSHDLNRWWQIRGKENHAENWR